MSKADADLVIRLRKSDVAAFDTLYWKYHQAVYRNILKFTKDKDAAEDILQEVFTRLWEKRLETDPAQSLAGWLFVISFNLSINYARKKLRELTAHRNLLLTDDLQDDDLAVNARYEEQYRLLEKAIEQLSPQKRRIVTLCKLEGKTYEEAACELNISRHTVKEHLSAAMTNLNEYVRRHAVYTHLAVLLAGLNG